MFLTVGVTHVDPIHYQPFFTGNTTSFLAAIQIVATAYGAWTVIPSAIAEIRMPARTAPRAILLSLAITTLLYSAVVAVLYGIIPATSFTTGSTVQ